MLERNLFRKSIVLFSFLFISFVISAQNAMIRGTVKDPNGAGLAGASVVLGGTKYGTVTDASGNYLLKVSPGTYTLIITFIGMEVQRKSVTVATDGVSENNFDMKPTGELVQVTITGSRSTTPRSRLQTPVPVDVIPISQVINDVGQVDLNQIMTFAAPSFQSARQTISDGTDHVDPAQLRGLGPDQVLVLINGKRRHQSALVNVNGTVNRGTVGTDLNAIPANAIERIEILRDGAAAQYGSDAISGVVNIILKKKTGLLEAGTSYGQYFTKYPKNYALYKLTGKTDDPDVKVRDGKTYQAFAGYGFGIGKGYLYVTGEYTRRGATNRAGTYTGAVYPNVNGVNRDDSIMQARGLTRDFFDMRIGNSEIKGGAVMYNFAYPTGNNSEIYSFGGFSKKSGESAGVYRYPSAIAAASAAGQYASQVFQIYPNGFLPLIVTDVKDFSAAVGFRTKINEWNLDFSNTFGRNSFDFNVENSINYTQFVGPNPGQTKFNSGGTLFWQNTFNQDVSRKFDVLNGLNIAFGSEFRIDAFGINSGEEASYKKYGNPGATETGGAQVFPGFVNAIGDTKERNATAVYLDLEQDFTDKFLATGALRFEHYSDFGSTLNYKFSARYKFSDKFILRGSLSSGFRAPSQQQKYFAKTNTLFVSTPSGLVPVQSGTFTNDSQVATILGIPKLKEETSNNYSVGLAAKPFKGFELTADAYLIDIDNRIILTNNFTGGSDPALKAQLDAAGAGAANVFTNAVDTRSKGFETVLSYNKNFSGKHSLKTTFALTLIESEVKDSANGKPIIHASPVLINSGQIRNYFNREDESRMEVASPKSKMSLTFNYRYSKFGAMLRLVNFGKVIYLDPAIDPANPGAFPVNAFTGQKETLDQEFSSKLVTDLSLSYELINELTLTVGANNLFDVYQDMHTHSGNFSTGRFIYSRRVQQMGFNGAYYFARLKLSLNPNK
jgi:iron complex outermembrane receptor protein